MKIQEIALKIRQKVFTMACRANGGHIAPAYSMTDIVAELYFDDILRYNPTNAEWQERDYFVLSKGHGVLALYAALALAGYFPMEELASFCQPGSRLGSLAKMGAVPGIEASTGSLGHGLSFAVGVALACKLDSVKNHVYVLAGDGVVRPCAGGYAEAARLLKQVRENEAAGSGKSAASPEARKV